MVERVVEEEKEAIENRLKETRAQAVEQENQEIEQLEQEAQEQKEAIESSLEKEFSREKQSELVKKRNQSLTNKQEILTKLREDAVQQFNEMPSVDFQNFMYHALRGIDREGKLVIEVGEYSQDKVSEEQIQSWNSDKVQYQLADTVIPGESGFLVSQGNVQYNFLFKSLIMESWSEIESQLASELFI